MLEFVAGYIIGSEFGVEGPKSSSCGGSGVRWRNVDRYGGYSVDTSYPATKELVLLSFVEVDENNNTAKNIYMLGFYDERFIGGGKHEKEWYVMGNPGEFRKTNKIPKYYANFQSAPPPVMNYWDKKWMT